MASTAQNLVWDPTGNVFRPSTTDASSQYFDPTGANAPPPAISTPTLDQNLVNKFFSGANTPYGGTNFNGPGGSSLPIPLDPSSGYVSQAGGISGFVNGVPLSSLFPGATAQQLQQLYGDPGNQGGNSYSSPGFTITPDTLASYQNQQGATATDQYIKSVNAQLGHDTVGDFFTQIGENAGEIGLDAFTAGAFTAGTSPLTLAANAAGGIGTAGGVAAAGATGAALGTVGSEISNPGGNPLLGAATGGIGGAVAGSGVLNGIFGDASSSLTPSDPFADPNLANAGAAYGGSPAAGDIAAAEGVANYNALGNIYNGAQTPTLAQAQAAGFDNVADYTSYATTYGLPGVSFNANGTIAPSVVSQGAPAATSAPTPLASPDGAITNPTGTVGTPLDLSTGGTGSISPGATGAGGAASLLPTPQQAQTTALGTPPQASAGSGAQDFGQLDSTDPNDPFNKLGDIYSGGATSSTINAANFANPNPGSASNTNPTGGPTGFLGNLGQAGTDLAAGSVGAALGDVGKAVGSAVSSIPPSVALSAGLLGAGALLKPTPNTANLNTAAANASGVGNALQQALLTGQLPAGLQAQINQATNAAQAAIRSQFANAGLTGSSMEAQALAGAAQTAMVEGYKIATQMAELGVQDTQLSADIYKTILGDTNANDNAFSSAITNFAIALAGGGVRQAASG